VFPNFSIHSTPLLIFVIQGLIFAGLLLYRYKTEKKDADLLIGLILLAMAYHRTTYTIGFMGWYDTYKNTKINYSLVSFGLAMGPLIYLYVRSLTSAPFRLEKRDLIHFIPIGIFLIYRVVLLAHDATQDGWEEGYRGKWMASFDDVYVDPFIGWINYSSQLLYLSFTLMLFFQYRKKTQQFFSNTFKVQLSWIRNFLYVYIALFIYVNITDVVDMQITPLDYGHRWWAHLFSSIAIVYLGVKAYFTDLTGLYSMTFDISDTVSTVKQIDSAAFANEQQLIRAYIESENTYLNPDFTLKQLAQGAKMSLHDVSEVINTGMGVNFNELINRYRVEEVKRRLVDPKNDHLSLMAIGLDSGFNSKATFNRVFKQIAGMSPSQYKQQTE